MTNSPFSELETALITSQYSDTGPSVLSSLVKSVIEGKFREVFKGDIAHHLFTLSSSSWSDRPLSESFKFNIPSLQTEYDQQLARLALAVGCLRAFLQVNWTGPDLDIQPSETITIPELPDGSNTISLNEQALNAKAIAELAYAGEPAYHLAKGATFFRLAQLILTSTSLTWSKTPTVSWWRLRIATIHQNLLDEPVGMPASLFEPLDLIAAQLIQYPDLAGRLELERGLIHHVLRNDRVAADFFVRAARAMHLEYELTGALGKRTRFQQRDVTQLVLLAQSRDRKERGDEEHELPEKEKNVIDGITDHTLSTSNSSTQTLSPNSVALPENLLLNDDTLLEQTVFTSSSRGSSEGPAPRLVHLDPASQPALHPLDQCVLLAMCLNVRNTSPSHGLTSEQMSPYIARVISHPRNWTIHTIALLLRSRLESTRTRTVERSTLQLQALIDQMPSSDSTLAERLHYFHDIPLPSKWELEKELAMRFMSLGVLRSALEIFERLEMWEYVVKCWQSMERPDKGIQIVRDLLEGKKEESEVAASKYKAKDTNVKQRLDVAQEAKLWCLLGDLEPSSAFDHYTHAWEVSNHTSGRAIRSLGGYHFARNEFSLAIPCLQHAVRINPLLERTWFVLGCACVHEEQWEDARDAFARCVAIDDEDGESWSNLASVYLKMGAAGHEIVLEKDIDDRTTSISRTDETITTNEKDDEHPSPSIRQKIPATNKILAFRALQQGLKHSYSNWRMWTNYMFVAMDPDVDEPLEATRAFGRIVEETYEKDGDKFVDWEILERLIDLVSSSTKPTPASTSSSGSLTESAADDDETQRLALRKSLNNLFTSTLLPRFNTSPAHTLHARLHLSSRPPDYMSALTSYLAAYRSFGTEVVDTEGWKEAVKSVETVVEALKEVGPLVDRQREEKGGSDEDEQHPSGVKWQKQARGILRTFLGRTRADFGDEPEYEKLEELAQEFSQV